MSKELINSIVKIYSSETIFNYKLSNTIIKEFPTVGTGFFINNKVFSKLFLLKLSTCGESLFIILSVILGTLTVLIFLLYYYVMLKILLHTTLFFKNDFFKNQVTAIEISYDLVECFCA